MSRSSLYDSPEAVAKAAAEKAIETLRLAIDTYGDAVWVLAGGTSPMLAYAEIRDNYADALDWAKITVLIGDERMVPFDSIDSNWGNISPLLAIDVRRIIPQTEVNEAEAAREFAEAIIRLGQPTRLDLVWVGVGEDGHTLSLFPSNPAFTNPTNDLVVAVHDSPKLPPTRMTLTLKALQSARDLVIFAVGESKKEALLQARTKGELPIAKVTETVETHGGKVLWLYDQAAWTAIDGIILD